MLQIAARLSNSGTATLDRTTRWYRRSLEWGGFDDGAWLGHDLYAAFLLAHGCFNHYGDNKAVVE